MQEDKTNKKIDNYIYPTTRYNQNTVKNTVSQLNKTNGTLKFSRQQEKQKQPRSLLYGHANLAAKENDNNKEKEKQKNKDGGKVEKVNFIVPELNLIKIHVPKEDNKIKTTKITQQKGKYTNKPTQNNNQYNVVINQHKKVTSPRANSKNKPQKQAKQKQISNNKQAPLTSYRLTQQIKNTPTIPQPTIQLTPTNRIPQNNEATKIKSPIRTLLKSKGSQKNSQSLDDQVDKEQLLLLEIKQLKRQNTFLKKKIRDLNKELNGGYFPQEYQRSKSPAVGAGTQSNLSPPKKQKKGAPKHANIQNLHLTVNLFFQQVRHLLNSVTQLFKIQFTQQQINKFQSLHTNDQMIQQLNEQICPLKKHQILKKYFLKRKLDRLAIEQEQKRYTLLLSIFTEYYKYKEQSEKRVISIIDSIIMYMSDLNKWLIEKAYSKRMKSQICSQKSTEREFINMIEPPKFDTLRVPPNNINHVTKNRGANLSPMPKKNHA